MMVTKGEHGVTNVCAQLHLPLEFIYVLLYGPSLKPLSFYKALGVFQLELFLIKKKIHLFQESCEEQGSYLAEPKTEVLGRTVKKYINDTVGELFSNL